MVLPIPLFSRKKTVTDKFNGFVIYIIISGLSKFGQKIDNQFFNLLRLQESKKNWTDKGDHDNYLIRSSVADKATPATTEGEAADDARVPSF